MTAAVKAIVMGGSSKKSDQTILCSAVSLQRYLKSVSKGEGIAYTMGRPSVLTKEQEDELVEYILHIEAKLYGLTPADVRIIV